MCISNAIDKAQKVTEEMNYLGDSLIAWDHERYGDIVEEHSTFVGVRIRNCNDQFKEIIKQLSEELEKHNPPKPKPRG